MNENCGMVQNRGGNIGDCSDVTFREAENDELRRVDAVKKQRISNVGKRVAERATLEETCWAKTFHSRLDALRSGKKAMRAAADGSVAHLLLSNLLHLHKPSEIVDLEEKAKAEELWLVTQLFYAETDAAYALLCQNSKDRVIGQYFQGLDPRINMIGANMSESGVARPFRDRQELRENVHTHFTCYIRDKRDAVLAAVKAHKIARKDALEKQVYEVESVEEDGVTPVLNSSGQVVKVTLTYRELVSAMDKLNGATDGDEITLAPVMRAVFGWVTYALIYRGGFGGDPFGMDRWSLSPQCVAWHGKAFEILIRYKKLMHPLKPVHAHKELHCMHAIIIASWDTYTPLTWNRVRPLFFGYDIENPLHWSAQCYCPNVRHVVVQPVRLVQLLEDVQRMAFRLGAEPDWHTLTRNFAIHFEEQLRQTYHFKPATMDRSVLSLVDHVCRSITKIKHKNALRQELAAAAASSQPSSAAQSLIDFCPQVVAISCVRSVYVKHPFGVTDALLDDIELLKTVTIKIMRKEQCRKRPRVSVTKNGQDVALIKADAFNSLAGVESSQVTACVQLLQPFLPSSLCC
jgi:hypothetical protein